MIATDTVRIRFASAGSSVLPTFEPGAHIEISFAGLTRRYSLTSLPSMTDHYEICVLRTNPSAGGSAYIHDQLKLGDTVEVSEPLNAFPLNRDATHTVFIAGGIGVTPFYTMMDALRRIDCSFELHYAARSKDRFLPGSAFVDRSRHYPDADGRPSLDVDGLLGTIPAQSDIYVCGPRALIEMVRATASSAGWAKDRIHFESFGASVRPGDRPVSVRLARSGMTIKIKPGTTILDALLENGVWATYECRRGCRWRGGSRRRSWRRNPGGILHGGRGKRRLWPWPRHFGSAWSGRCGSRCCWRRSHRSELCRPGGPKCCGPRHIGCSPILL